MTSLVLNAFRDLRTPKLDRVWLASLVVIALIAIFIPRSLQNPKLLVCNDAEVV